MKLLVTGGAGYIGSFMVNALVDAGHNVVVFDNLERGHYTALNQSSKFIKGDIKDKKALDFLFSQEKIEAVFHFAGLISVEESTKNPDLYFENNVKGSSNLFETAIEHNVNNFIFSSTAAVYGNPTQIPIPETHPKNPTSPYGKSKLDTELNLAALRESNPLVSFACLRYFNASGAALDGTLGESHSPETHIIPLAIKAAIEKMPFKLFGTDYSTSDGTCVRDYIHVLDLVQAHLLALDKILKEKGEYYYNVGTGVGISNKEVIDMVSKISGLHIEKLNEKRRAGDADQLIADPAKIQHELMFTPKYSDLETIVKSAWEWHRKQ